MCNRCWERLKRAPPGHFALLCLWVLSPCPAAPVGAAAPGAGEPRAPSRLSTRARANLQVRAGQKANLGQKHPQGELAPQLVPTPALGISVCSVRRAASTINSVLRQHGPDPAHGAGTAWGDVYRRWCAGFGGIPSLCCQSDWDRAGWGRGGNLGTLGCGFCALCGEKPHASVCPSYVGKEPRVGAPHEGPPRADAGDHDAGIPAPPGTPEVTLRGAPMCQGGPPPRQVPVPQPCRGFSALE